VICRGGGLGWGVDFGHGLSDRRFDRPKGQIFLCTAA